jgi:hypothetical protein
MDNQLRAYATLTAVERAQIKSKIVFREKKAAAPGQPKVTADVETISVRSGVKRWSSLKEMEPDITNGNTNFQVNRQNPLITKRRPTSQCSINQRSHRRFFGWAIS